MPRAAPGVIARGALRRKNKGNSCVSVRESDRYKAECSFRLGMETHIRPDERWSRKRFPFTLHLSGFEVERGRLGKVESLVGDCRPPPPGNPRQPIMLFRIKHGCCGFQKNPVDSGNGFDAFIPKWQKNGGVFLRMCKHHSFKNTDNPYNLKKLVFLQYFKNNCSYFSCAEKCSVLESCNFHYHLYGLWLVEPPSIAITNVLKIKDYLYALPVL